MKNSKVNDTENDYDSNSSEDSSTDEPIKNICKSKTIDYVKQYNQKYYEKTKAKRLADIKMKVVCECGCELSQGRINKHKKTKKHINRIAQNANL